MAHFDHISLYYYHLMNQPDMVDKYSLYLRYIDLFYAYEALSLDRYASIIKE